jgi:hypothetical protein
VQAKCDMLRDFVKAIEYTHHKFLSNETMESNLKKATSVFCPLGVRGCVGTQRATLQVLGETKTRVDVATPSKKEGVGRKKKKKKKSR